MIEATKLLWRDGQPYSQSYDDIYHDVDGISEVEQVLLEPVGFTQLLAERKRLVIGELGFGTGLNFTVIAGRCLAAGVDLHFVSFENAPISAADFRLLARSRAQSAPVYAELAEVYPPHLAGWHRRRLSQGRVTLSLFWGEAEIGLSELVESQVCGVDLWLLDGFAPDRNPAMWTPALLKKVASSASQGSRLSTFSSVGRVRRDLSALGFRMRRVDQRPRKWESLAGIFEPAGRPRVCLPTLVRIVGAGIAGAAAARELAMSGVNVEIFERADQVSTGASCIPVTVMHPRLHHDSSPTARLRASSFTHAIAAIRNYVAGAGAEQDNGIRATGALQIASPNYPLERLSEVADHYATAGLNAELKTAAEANEMAGVPVDQPALWFPDACLLDTPQFTRALLDHPLIRVCTGSTVQDWWHGPTILACGYAAQTFPGAEYLELGLVHGQLDLVRAQHVPRVPVVGYGYVAPVIGARDLVGVGATYEYDPWPAEQASEQNYAHLRRLGCKSITAHSHVKAARCVSSDRNPVVGTLYSRELQPLAERLVSSGHGSMGTVTSHLSGALLDAALLGEVAPLDQSQRALLSPLRFRIRQARRGYRFDASN